MDRKPFLSDVRLDISAVCSACRTFLFAHLKDDKDEHADKPTLRAKLEEIFQRHVTEKHSNLVNCNALAPEKYQQNTHPQE